MFKPAKMSPDALQKMYEYAWNTFYSGFGKEVQMAKLYLKIIDKEKLDGTSAGPELRNRSKWGKKQP